MTQTTPTADEIDFQAAQWLLRHDDGLTAHELAALRQWIEADARHQQAWDELARTDALLASLPAQRVAAFSQPALPAPAPMSLRQRLAQCRLAASSLPRGALAGGCLLLCGSLAWPLASHLQRPGFQHDYSTARGQFATQILPDGSRIELDSGSAVDVALYRDRRTVRLLRGQAMFHVHADAARPFQVLAGSATATVLGTHFSVRHVGAATQVSVAQGTVRVEGTGAGQATVLHAGDTVTVTPQGMGALASVSAQAVGNWRDGRLNFENATLAEALAEFERYGDTGLQLDDPALAGMRLNGSFDARQPAQFAAALPLALPVRLLRQDGKLHIVAR
ncbi:FecR domain-containing protein [Janthinobacterium sp. SUN073]|uniref:FecR family protein n=1 Tax=Janthinobacterium sp. SUN073 TaxID=3004102 RepID=UPI0025B0A77B|nr:FecR domain-containing protein [Janthinobacterium sp. SUN073]MDN2697994.1 FecR domain-containing protein [Janthinobacterium sp. SUN073]